MNTHDRHVWEEIAVGGFIVALLLWFITSAFGKHGSPVVQASNPPAYFPAPAGSPGPAMAPAIASPPPLVIPAEQSFASNAPVGKGKNFCSGCSAGTTSNPTIQHITAITNSALEMMQAASAATIRSIAAIGNQSSGGKQSFLAGY